MGAWWADEKTARCCVHVDVSMSRLRIKKGLGRASGSYCYRAKGKARARANFGLGGMAFNSANQKHGRSQGTFEFPVEAGRMAASKSQSVGQVRSHSPLDTKKFGYKERQTSGNATSERGGLCMRLRALIQLCRAGVV